MRCHRQCVRKDDDGIVGSGCSCVFSWVSLRSVCAHMWLFYLLRIKVWL